MRNCLTDEGKSTDILGANRAGIRSIYLTGSSYKSVDEHLSGIRDLVRSTLAVYRADRNSRQLAASDIDDLRLLILPEVKRKRLILRWQNCIEGTIGVAAGPVRDAILNLLLNACEASPMEGTVAFDAKLTGELLAVAIADRGEGLPPHVEEYLEKPDAGSAPLDQRSGLGLWMVKRLCQELGGTIAASTSHGRGTRITLSIPLGREVLRHVA